jgi:hypothetical protein
MNLLLHPLIENRLPGTAPDGVSFRSHLLGA